VFPVSDVIPSRRRPVVTVGLIAVNTIVFLYELRLDAPAMHQFALTWGLVPAEFAWSRVPASAFIHDGWIHFGGNMLYLWIFGDNVEDAMGHLGYLAFFVAAAGAGALAHTLVHPASTVPLIGASGAIAAVMGAYFVLYPRSQVLTAIFLVLYLDIIEVPAIFFLGVWLLMQVFSGLASMGAQAADAGVAFAAHLAGFGVGVVAGAMLRRRRPWESDR
jgi:membrane associated rhomboid family serine protease